MTLWGPPLPVTLLVIALCLAVGYLLSAWWLRTDRPTETRDAGAEPASGQATVAAVPAVTAMQSTDGITAETANVAH